MFAHNTDGRQDRLGLLACGLAVSTDSAAGWMATRNSDDRSVVVWVQKPAGLVSWEVSRDLVGNLPLEQKEIDLEDTRHDEQSCWLADWLAEGDTPAGPCPYCNGSVFHRGLLGRGLVRPHKSHKKQQ
jgi:hypothetical protein